MSNTDMERAWVYRANYKNNKCLSLDAANYSKANKIYRWRPISKVFYVGSSSEVCRLIKGLKLSPVANFCPSWWRGKKKNLWKFISSFRQKGVLNSFSYICFFPGFLQLKIIFILKYHILGWQIHYSDQRIPMTTTNILGLNGTITWKCFTNWELSPWHYFILNSIDFKLFKSRHIRG